MAASGITMLTHNAQVSPAFHGFRAWCAGKDEESVALLSSSSVTLTTAKPGSVLELSADHLLRLLPTPTPRWPDLLAVYSSADRILFSSKLFACHVAPSKANASNPYDEGGWDVYGNDWRYYFDCMLAPVARQAAGE